MSVELAKPVFTTGIDEQLATVDAYGVDNPDDISGLNGGEDFSLENIQGMLGGNLGNPADLLKDDVPDGMLLEPDKIRENLIAALPDAGGALSGMDSAMVGNLLNVEAGSLSQIQATVGDATAMINGADLSSLQGVGELVGGLTQSDFPISLKDCSGITEVGANVLSQCCRLGVPGAYTQFATGLTRTGDLDLLGKITQKVLPVVCSSSNIGMLGEMAKGPLGSSLTSLMPGVLASFSKAYTLPKGTTSSQMRQTSLKVVGTFSTIQPSWNKTAPISTRSTNMYSTSTRKNSSSLVVNASADFKKLLTVAAKSIVQPLMVAPKVITQGPSVLDPSYGSGFPAGTNSTAQALPDGSTRTIYVLPDGTTVTHVLSADKQSGSATTQYPPQMCPAGTPTSADGWYSGVGEDTAFQPGSDSLWTPTDVSDTPTLDPANFGTTAFGADSIQEVFYDANGDQIRQVTTSSGETYTQRVANDGTVENEILQQYYQNEFDSAQDPYGNLPINTVSDPIAMGYVAIDVDQQASQYDGTQGLASMDAMEALQTSFPETYIG